MESDTANELADLYDQLRYNLELLRGFVVTIDAAVRTTLQFEQLAESFQAKLGDGKYLTNSSEIIQQVDLALLGVRAKAERLRRAPLPPEPDRVN
ncbi:MAG: hypothetical protein ABSH00_04025 [Bryobacteraceae bacterium]|jgi:hypothetical protein